MTHLLVSLVEGEVFPFDSHQDLMGPRFHHFPSTYDEDGVGTLYGGQSVGYDDAGATFLGFVQGLLHNLRTDFKKFVWCSNRDRAVIHWKQILDPAARYSKQKMMIKFILLFSSQTPKYLSFWALFWLGHWHGNSGSRWPEMKTINVESVDKKRGM